MDTRDHDEKAGRKMKTRRGTHKAKEIALYFNNINGIKSKTESLFNILGKLEPEIVCLCETKSGNSTIIENQLKEAGYKGITRCAKSGQGGLLMAAKIKTMSAVVDVTCSPSKRILVGRLNIRGGHLRIILGYAPQETDTPEIREEFFDELAIEIQAGTQEGDAVLVVGDLNAKIEGENTEEMFPVSKNGVLMIDMVKESNLTVMNLSPKCVGKWTHVIRISGEMSRLDYGIADGVAEKMITNLLIDESTLLCPFHVKNKEITLSDHNPIVINLKIQEEKKKKNHNKKVDEQKIRWKLTPKGIKKLQETCEEMSTSRSTDEQTTTETTQNKYDLFEEKLRSIMDKCFKRLNTKEQEKTARSTEGEKYQQIIKQINEFSKKGKAHRKVAKEYTQEILKLQKEDVTKKRAERIVEVANKMSIDGNFNIQKYWKLRKSMKRNNQTCSSVIRDGEEVFITEQIIRAFRDEFETRLKKPEMADWLKEISEKTELILNLLTENVAGKSPPFTRKELLEVIKEMVSGKACGPDGIPPEIFIFGGEALLKILLEIINIIKTNGEIPSQWNEVDITTLYKNKGNRKDLKNQRGIFLTVVAYKLFERLVKKRTKDHLKNINLLQAGGRDGRMTTDQTFIMRSIINHTLYLGIKLYIVCYDYKQCFDKLGLKEAVLSLWRLGMDEEYLNLILKLNETAEISIKTPFGMTERFTAKSITKQGTVLGPTLCGGSLGECLDLLDEGNGASIGNVSIPALAFVDDMNCMETKVNKIHRAHEKTVWFAEKKDQPLNEEKCEIMCVNSSDGDVVPVLEVQSKVVKNVENICYVGDFFNIKGNNNDLIQDRIRKGTICMRSTIAECTDITLGQYAIHTLLTMYNAVFVQTLLFNSGGWCNLSKQNEESLRVLQMKYLRRILHIPNSTPCVAILRELGVKPIEMELHARQLSFLHHIISLEEEDPVRRVYNQQKRFIYEDSWYREIRALQQKYNLDKEEEEIREMSKDMWKGLVSQKISEVAVNKLNEVAAQGKKTKSFPMITKLKCQEYLKKLSPKKARLLFRIRSKMVDLRGVYTFKYNNQSCRLCGAETEDIEHVLNICPHVEEKSKALLTNEEIYGDDLDGLKEVTKRMKTFLTKVTEK